MTLNGRTVREFGPTDSGLVTGGPGAGRPFAAKKMPLSMKQVKDEVIRTS